MIKSVIRKKDSKKQSKQSKQSKQLKQSKQSKQSNKSIRKNVSKKKTYKIIKMLSNLKNFKNIYKKFNKEEKDTLVSYKQNGYRALNEYLYNNNTIKTLTFDKYFYLSNIKSGFSNNTKDLFDYKNIDITNIPKFVEFYVNNIIIKKINIIDSIFTNKDIPKLDGSELLYRGKSRHTGTTDKSKIGDEIVFKNFLSTSTEEENSLNFISSYSKKVNKDKKDICCMYVISGCKNVPYIYLPWSINAKFEKLLVVESTYDEFEYLLPRNLKFKITNITKGIKDEKTDSFKKLTFEQLENLIKKKNLNKINNNDIDMIIEKIFNKIKFIHLEYVEQLPTIKIPTYIYDEKLTLHFPNIDKNNKNN